MLWIIRSEVPFTILRALSAPWFHLWFVPALFLFCFITTLLRRLPALAVLSVFFLPHLAIWAADSELKPAGIPINYRPPFRFEAGHDSNQLSAVFRL